MGSQHARICKCSCCCKCTCCNGYRRHWSTSCGAHKGTKDMRFRQSAETAGMICCTQPTGCLWQQTALRWYRCCCWWWWQDNMWHSKGSKPLNYGEQRWQSICWCSNKEGHIRRRHCLELTKKVKTGSNQIVLDANIMFARLLIITAHSGDTESCFQHELTSVLTALFKESRLQKMNKSAPWQRNSQSRSTLVVKCLLVTCMSWMVDAFFTMLCGQRVLHILTLWMPTWVTFTGITQAVWCLIAKAMVRQSRTLNTHEETHSRLPLSALRNICQHIIARVLS